MKIVQRFHEPYPAWRGGISICPECKFDQLSHALAFWLDVAKVQEIAIDPFAPYAKSNSVLVSSECPHCFTISWTHTRLDSICFFEDWNWPIEVIAIMEKEKERRETEGKLNWRQSICKNCKLLESVSYISLYPYRICKMGMGPVFKPKTECERFTG